MAAIAKGPHSYLLVGFKEEWKGTDGVKFGVKGRLLHAKIHPVGAG